MLMDLEKLDAQVRLADIIKEIRAADKAYYQEDAPTMSDANYDKLRGELEAIEEKYPDLITKDSPTQTVGAVPSKGFQKVMGRLARGPKKHFAQGLNFVESAAYSHRPAISSTL